MAAEWPIARCCARPKMTSSSYDNSAVSSYNLTAAGHITVSGATPSQGYIRFMLFTPIGMHARTFSGATEHTYFCDHQWSNNAQLSMALFGGGCNAGAHCGAFALYLANTVAVSNWAVGASPQYL